MPNFFAENVPAIQGNHRVRTPQSEAFLALAEFATSDNGAREVGVILPVGCGKSGTIAIAPFAFRSARTLVVAPGLNIATQLFNDFDPALPSMFYQKCQILPGPAYPEPVEIRGTDTNRGDLDEADVVVTNIQQLQGGENNRWLRSLPENYFDLILFDEGHHGVAASWEDLKGRFPQARVVNFSATPMRADGQVMAGQVVYSFPIYRAIQAGYVKRLKAVQLNPRTLKYVREEDGQEIEVTLDEVRELGETDAGFRRSIVTSALTLNTIVDASIRALQSLRQANSGDSRLKIIASALNFQHCGQIVQAYRARGMRADYVHSLENSATNARTLKKLKTHELDVIVQVRKLGEGFDHPYLSVAAVFSVFSNLSPFVQFVGRVMRVIEQNAPEHPMNQGIVVFHAGADIARRWSDFQAYSEADQAYFDTMLSLEDFDPSSTASEREVSMDRVIHDLEVREQSDVRMEEIQLLSADLTAAILLLQQSGLIPTNFDPKNQVLTPVPTTLARERKAMRAALPSQTLTEARRILGERGINPQGTELDVRRLGRTNLIVMKSTLDRQINSFVGRGTGERSEFTRADLERIAEGYDAILNAALSEVFRGD